MSDDKLTDIVDKFQEYLDYFKLHHQFRGPSIYFHEKVIALCRQQPLSQLVQSEPFIGYLYAVLTAWGMHRMDRGAQLEDFGKFWDAVKGLSDIAMPLQDRKLSQLDKNALDCLCYAMEEYTVMKSGKRLVGKSKVRHHLLPDLVPPIDSNVKDFFGIKNSDETTHLIAQFKDAMKDFKRIHDRINWQTIKYDGPMNTSHPKLIDNAILGYIGKNVTEPKKASKEEIKKRKKEEQKEEKEEFKKWKKSRRQEV